MWFAPPPQLPTRVVTRLPDEFRKPFRNAWSDVNRAGAAVDAAFEGPCFDANGNLYIWVLNAIAEPCYRIVSCAGRTLTNCAFAADGKTLFITDSETASILACEVPPP